MAATSNQVGVEVCEVSPEERWVIFDHAARRYLGLDGERFMNDWDAGKFDARTDDPKVTRVAMLRPVGR